MRSISLFLARPARQAFHWWMIRGSVLSSSGIGSGSSKCCELLPGGLSSSFITQCLRGGCHGRYVCL